MEETLQYLQIATNVIVILLFIGLVILVFKLISGLKAVMAKVEDVSGQVKSIKAKIDPAIEKIEGLTENVNSVVDKVKDNIAVLEKVVTRVKDTADGIIDFEQKIQRKIEPPVLNTVNTISAVSIGIRTFIDRLVHRKRNSIYSTGDVDMMFDLKEEDDTMDEVNRELDDVNLRLTDLQK